MMKPRKTYSYNGKRLTVNQYSKLIAKKTGGKITTIAGRIRKGWPIEKLLLPDTVKRPVYQYGVDGVFKKSFTSIAEALRSIRKAGASAIRRACLKPNAVSHGYLWRYADDVPDTTVRLSLKARTQFKDDKDVYRLRKVYISIRRECYHKKGRWAQNPKIKLWDEWYNSWDRFLADLMPMYKLAIKQYSGYKSRLTQKELKNTNVWFSRIDKTEGFIPFNVCFTTPDWAVRHRPNSHRVNIDDKILFVPQIYDILRLQGRELTEGTIRSRVVNKRPIAGPTQRRRFEYKGQFFSGRELDEMFGTPRHAIRRYITKYKLPIEEAIEAAKTYRHNTVIYQGTEYRQHELAKLLSAESSLPYGLLASRIRDVAKHRNGLTQSDIDKLLKAKKVKRIYVKATIEGAVEGIEKKRMAKGKISLTDLAKKHGLPYKVVWRRIKKGASVEEAIKGKRVAQTLIIDGITYKMAAAAKMLGISEVGLRYRIKRGWNPGEIKKITRRFYFNSIKEDERQALSELECKDCHDAKSRKAFPYRNKAKTLIGPVCKACVAKKAGIKEPGAILRAKELFTAGFRKCCDCKGVLELDSFSKSKRGYGGYSNICQECSRKRTKRFVQRQQADMGKFYLTQKAMLKFGVKRLDVTDEMRAATKQEILQKREPKYSLDGKDFVTMAEAARYIHEKYGVEETTVTKRLGTGAAILDCTLPEKEYRSMMGSSPLIITDLVTGIKYEFKNQRAASVMMGRSTITACLKNNRPSKVWRGNKWPNPCSVEIRVSNLGLGIAAKSPQRGSASEDL